MKFIREIGKWLKPDRKEVPEDLMTYLASVYEMQITYKKDIKGPRNKLQNVLYDYIHEQGLWRITEEVKSVTPIPEEATKDQKNVFLLRLYFGEYGAVYCYGFAGFVKEGKKWKYLGKERTYTFPRLPRPDEISLNFTDEAGEKQSEDCQGFHDFYYQY